MGASNPKCNSKKNKLQKKVKRLQTEQDELKAKLLRCELDLEEKDQYIEQITRKYEQIIRNLRFELRGSETFSKKSDAKIFIKEKIFNWMIDGVLLSMTPLAANVSFSWFYGYNIRIADILTDFVLVLFAISMNLRSIISDETSHSRPNLAIHSFVVLIAMISLEVSLCLSISRFVSGETILTQPVTVNVIFGISALCIIAVIVLGIFIIIRRSRKHIGMSD